MKTTYSCELLQKAEIAAGIFDYTVAAPFADEIAAGQFINIDCGDKVYLRRPISVCDTTNTTVRFIFEVKGAGTRELSTVKVGDKINILGPLGNSFGQYPEYKRAVIIGGGIGVFPLYKLAKDIHPAAVFLGFRTADRVVMEDEFKSVCPNTFTATDDGTYGLNGYAINFAKSYIDEQGADIIYSCGPMPLLRAVKAAAEERGIPCRLSLEQRMGCGIGACLVCSCETVFEGSDKYKRICKDGPVFWSEEVTLNG